MILIPNFTNRKIKLLFVSFFPQYCSEPYILLILFVVLDKFLSIFYYFAPVCDGTQNVKRYQYRYFFTVPNIFDTDPSTFFGTKFSRYRFRDFFPILNFAYTGSETFFRYQIFPIPVPIPPEIWKIPGSGTFSVPVPIINLQNS